MIAPALARLPLGAHTLLRLGTDDHHVAFVPSRAGYVHQVRLRGRDLLWNYPDGAALDANDGYRNLALAPFPNRLLEGRYGWGGRELAFDVNAPDTRSALHGFGPEVAFRLERVDLSRTAATAYLTYLHTPALHPASYPFAVRFDLALEVDLARASAAWRLAATNLGDGDAPVGLGWHPYFLLPGGLDAWAIEMPPNERVVLERAIPTGARAGGLPPKRALPIDPSWDDCLALTDAAERTVRLVGPEYVLALEQTAATRYTQLYVPPGDGSVAVEPMTCNVNAFADAPEEVRLAPGGRLEVGMRISVDSPCGGAAGRPPRVRRPGR